jgi:heme-degrading monooxygenase HmoA
MMNTAEFLIKGEGKVSPADDGKGGKSVFARIFTIEGRREQFDGFARGGKEKVFPALRRLDGSEGLPVLANRRSGKILVVILWESEEAVRGGEEGSHWFRAFGAEVTGGEVTEVERYEAVYPKTEGNEALAGAPDILSLGGR